MVVMLKNTNQSSADVGIAELLLPCYLFWYEWTVAGLASFRLQGFTNAKLPFRSDQLICCAESQRQSESGGANMTGLQEQDTEDLETQLSQSDDDLQFEPQTSGTLTCCTPAICTSKSVQPWHLLAVTAGLAAPPC